jgi:PKD repeat protein
MSSIYTTVGQLKISPDGKRLAMSTQSISVSPDAGFHLFDFDAATGVVSNSLILNNSTERAYGIEFSPDGSKLYGITWNASAVPTHIYQWNVCAPTPTAILASQYSFTLGNLVMGSAQRAIDGKIYIVAYPQQSVSIINNPNASGAAMGFSLDVLSIGTKTATAGLPNYINTYIRPTAIPFTSTVNCNVASFTPVLPTFTASCLQTPYAPNGYLWNFGEPASGAANTSTLSNPVHSYSTTGTYTVSLILFNPCTNDTLKQTVTINSIGPETPAVAGPTVICKGDQYVYTASGGTTYAWSGGGTASTVALSPTATTAYTVSASANGCTQSKSFTVTVNSCLGISELGSAASIRLYPNPFNQSLTVNTDVPLKLAVYDLTGKLVLQTPVGSGQSEINTEHLPAGAYIIKASHENGERYSKLVKVE